MNCQRLLPLFLVVLLPGLMCATLPWNLPGEAAPPEQPYTPKIAPASDEGERALRRIQIPRDLAIDLFAAEPLLANPVAFCIDEQGRFYVAETFRLHAGVTDIRRHMDWLDEDLACRTVADRIALLRRRVPNQAHRYGTEHDRVRLIVDSNHDGQADRATIFADGFHSIEAGIGAGLVTRKGDVWFTCIPALWKLRDSDGDGRADVRKALQEGYGVHIGYLGHDLHGLVLGPDGKLYFSIGDRGLHVKTPEGILSVPDRGCVLRCNPDGSDLEIVHAGLRNPQELAFDQYGNLFTGDNNSDAGDQAKWIYLVEGGDSGWRIGYQFGTAMGQRGPFMAEGLWKPRFKEQPAYIVPPIANITNGPSGLVYYPGVGLPERYRNHFFLCDFRGVSAGSGVHSFALEPDGATFKMVDHDPKFISSLLVTDVAFGPDCAMYVSDWTEGWEQPGKGRIYRISDPAQKKNPLIAEVKQLLSEGLDRKSNAELARLLGHPHQRIRQEAQFTLAARGNEALPTLEETLKDDRLLARLHAIWGLGQIGRHNPRAYEKILALTKDSNTEVRAQAARVLGDGKVARSLEPLLALLHDPEPRVQFFAAQGLGRLGKEEAVIPVLALLRANADRDAYLRHAGVLALARCARPTQLAQRASAESLAVRRGAVLALRRQRSPEVARFLDDPDPALVEEAARAIYDVPIKEALPALAKLITRITLSEFTWYRVLNANFRLGEEENARAVARFVGRADVPEALRIEAVQELGDWANPPGRDRVMGLWRPLVPPLPDVAREAMKPALGAIFSGPPRLRREAAQVAGRLGIREVAPFLLTTLKDAHEESSARVAALQALHTLRDARVDEAVRLALDANDPRLRDEGRRVLAQLRPREAFTELEQALARGEEVEQQGALRTLGEMKERQAETLLSRWLDRLLEGKVPPALRLDLVEAAGQHHSEALKKQLARYQAEMARDKKLGAWRDCQVGGDAEEGRRIFFNKAEVSCLRCHKIKGVGGEVGPELAGIGAKQKRDYLVEAIAFPNRQIAKGYDSVLLFLINGKTVTGVLRSENDREVKVMTAEGNLVTVPKSQIDERQKGQSAMPQDLVKHLSRREMRDLVAFLAGLKTEPGKKK